MGKQTMGTPAQVCSPLPSPPLPSLLFLPFHQINPWLASSPAYTPTPERKYIFKVLTDLRYDDTKPNFHAYSLKLANPYFSQI